MLPPAHIEFTWAGLNLLQRQTGLFPEADYRLMALAAVLPDLIDKPLATFVLTDSNAALLFGHTVLLHDHHRYPAPSTHDPRQSTVGAVGQPSSTNSFGIATLRGAVDSRRSANLHHLSPEWGIE